MSAEALLALASPVQSGLWQALLSLLQVKCARCAGSRTLAESFRHFAAGRPARPIVLLDLDWTAAERSSLESVIAALRAALPQAMLFLVRSAGPRPTAGEARWARALGATDLLADFTAPGGVPRVERMLAAVARAIDRSLPDRATLTQVLRRAGGLPGADEDWVDEPTLGGFAGGHSFETLARAIAANRALRADRRFRLRTYVDCIVGGALVDWLSDTLGISREQAVGVGRALLAEGYLHHVVREQPFDDADYFYRLTDPQGRVDAVDPGAAIETLRAGVTVADRRWRGQPYPRAFLGRDAVDRLAGAFALNREDATSVGQRLLELGFFHHVVDDQQFRDGEFYYRFWTDET